ncbi:TauD/TfdA family dioxygenase [Nonomuraea sp. NPDC004580]|uniref:TauD/TfdA family dioxygenase n=1 Tax=Nonomuraea sp. NPDC004580 TaxID=3154552 RepID=UPI0033BB2E99
MSCGILPDRVDGQDTDRLRHLLTETGAAILTGLAATPDALVVAAALTLGHRLRQVFPYRSRPSRDAGPVHLHADSFDVVVHIGGVPVRRRDPDEDYVFIQAVQTPGSGGESFVADAYRFANDCGRRDPDPWDFLTSADVDLYGKWADLRGLPAVPRVGRHVEHHYRCWHGREGHSGERFVRILTVRSADAR